jgi:hypothetical protein
MRLGLVIMACRLDLLPQTLPDLLPHFDRTLILIDRKGEAEVRPFAESMGVEWMVHSFEHENYRCVNAMVAAVGCDWIFNLDSDESIRHPEVLRPLAEQLHSQGIAVACLPRHNWLDLDRTREEADFYPDFQPRLRHRSVRVRWRVHPDLEGHPTIVNIDPAGPLRIDHYAGAFRSPEDWQRVNEWYHRLMALDRADGREPWAGKDMRGVSA